MRMPTANLAEVAGMVKNEGWGSSRWADWVGRKCVGKNEYNKARPGQPGPSQGQVWPIRLEL